MQKYFIFFVGLIFGVFSYAQSLQPGLWQATSKFEVIGISLPSSEGEECITAEQAKDVRGTIAKELKKRGCEITQWNVKNKKLEASLSCQNNDLQAQGSLRGTVSAKTYELTGEAEGSFKGLPAQAGLKLKGKWIKSCPK